MDFETAVELRCIQSVGLAFLFVPIKTLSYAGVPPQKINQVSGIVNLSRNMGGDIGIAFVTTLIARRSQTHQVEPRRPHHGVQPGLQAKLAAMTRASSTAERPPSTRRSRRPRRCTGSSSQQATQLAYLDALSRSASRRP